MAKREKSMTFSMLGKKLGMTHTFDSEGNQVPVTAVLAGPNVVVQKKTQENDGYYAVQLGFDDKRKTRVNKATAGHFAKAKTPAKRYVEELRLDEASAASWELGQEIDASIFKPGDIIDVSATSQGKGFAGVVKKYGMRGQSATHGTHEMFRHVGSIGNCTKPGKVWKNKRMPGQMGNKRVTTQNLEVVQIFPEKNIIFVKGAVPGGRNSYVRLNAAVKGGFPERPLKVEQKAEAPAAAEEAPAETSAE